MIDLIDLCKNYSAAAGSPFQALRHVSVTVRHGEVLGVIGQSGAGKSTLLRCMNLLERPDHGQVRFDGQDLMQLDATALRQGRRRMSIIFQHFNLLDSATVSENVALPLRWAGAQAEAPERVGDLLRWMGLDAHAHKYPAQLSGGQKQRVAIARALACKPDVMLCDEATSALDPLSTQKTLQLLKRINHELGLTLVVISHEMAVVRELCTHVAVMEDGAVVEYGPVDMVFARPQHSLTAHMLEQSAVACLRCEQRCGCESAGQAPVVAPAESLSRPDQAAACGLAEPTGHASGVAVNSAGAPAELLSRPAEPTGHASAAPAAVLAEPIARGDRAGAVRPDPSSDDLEQTAVGAPARGRRGHR